MHPKPNNDIKETIDKFLEMVQKDKPKKLWEIGFKGNFDFAWEGENNLIKCGISDSQNQGNIS